MNKAQRGLCRTLALSRMVGGNVSLGFGQASDPKSPAVVDQIMADALARCYSITADGVKKIEFVSATSEEFADVEALGQRAIAPLQAQSRRSAPLSVSDLESRSPRLLAMPSLKGNYCVSPLRMFQKTRRFPDHLLQSDPPQGIPSDRTLDLIRNL
jgi:hypothetical protein